MQVTDVLTSERTTLTANIALNKRPIIIQETNFFVILYHHQLLIIFVFTIAK